MHSALVGNLSHVANHSFPTLDLTSVICMSPAHIVATIPLEPASRIIGMYPAFCLPHRKGLACIHPKEVQMFVLFLRPLLSLMRRLSKLGVNEPVTWKLLKAICHILSSEHTEFKHLFGSEVWLECWIKVFSLWFSEVVDVSRLHPIVDYYFLHICDTCDYAFIFEKSHAPIPTNASEIATKIPRSIHAEKCDAPFKTARRPSTP